MLRHLLKISRLLLVLGAGASAFAASPDIVFKDKAGRVLRKQDLVSATGAFEWEIRSGKAVPAEAMRLHELGRAAGQHGKSAQALDYFAQASRLAPDWPYPLYDAAFTQLLARQYTTALDLYRRVDRLAPRGFFTAKTAVHTLEQELAGKLPEGIYRQYLTLEWAPDDIQRARIIESLIERSPRFAPAWKSKALLEPDARKRLLLLERGLALDPDQETAGFLRLNKAAALNELGRRAEAIDMLGTMALDPTSPVDIEALARKSLALMLLR